MLQGGEEEKKAVDEFNEKIDIKSNEDTTDICIFNDKVGHVSYGEVMTINVAKSYDIILEKVNVDSGEFTLSSYDYGGIEVFEMKNMSRQQCVLLMSACDLFALPSKSEGSPQALKEAMACNCPILATDIADVKHLLGNLEGHYICTFDADNVEHQIKNAIAFNGRTKGRGRILELGLTNNQIANKIVNIYKTILQ